MTGGQLDFWARLMATDELRTQSGDLDSTGLVSAEGAQERQGLGEKRPLRMST